MKKFIPFVVVSILFLTALGAAMEPHTNINPIKVETPNSPSHELLNEMNVQSLNQQSENNWNKTFGGKGEDVGYSVIQTSDGGYASIGETTSYGIGGGDAWLLKVNSNGTEEWNKTYGGRRQDCGFVFQQTIDKGYIIAGWTSSYSVGDSDFWLVKTDENGNELWNKSYGGEKMDSAYAVQQTADHGYIMTGATESFKSGEYFDVWLIKTDENGAMVWNKTFGGDNWDFGYSVKQTADGGYILTGDTLSYGAGGCDVLLIKTDTQGNTQWMKTFGGDDWEWGYCIDITTDGGYIISGGKCLFNASHVWLIKTDSGGNKLWDRTFDSEPGQVTIAGCCVQQTHDQGYILSGWKGIWDDANNPSDIIVIKTDENGIEQWDMVFGGEKTDYTFGRSIQQTSDGGYIVIGATLPSGKIQSDLWLIKITEPNLSVKILGGFGASASIKNIGDETLTDITWSVVLEKKGFVKKHFDGTIETLSSSQETTIGRFLLFGLGLATIRVAANGVGNTAQCVFIGPFVIIRK